MNDIKRHQGYLCVSYQDLVSRYGEINQIEDRDGWELEICGYELEIVTFDHEEPTSETAWHIRSPYQYSLQLLAREFGAEALSDIRPIEVMELAA